MSDATDNGYCEKYDSFYDIETGEWLDNLCSDTDCEFCTNRPGKYSDEIEKGK